MSAGSEWSVEIKAPREMAVALGDVGALIKQYRQELRAAQRESNASIRATGDVNSNLEAKVQYAKSRLDAAVDQRNYIKAMSEGSLIDMGDGTRPSAPSHNAPDQSRLASHHYAQDKAQTRSAQSGFSSAVNGAMGQMPIWAMNQSGAVGLLAKVNAMEYYGKALANSTSLKEIASGVGRTASVARVGMSAGRGMMALASEARLAAAGPVGVGLAVAYAMGQYYSAKTESMLNQGRLRDTVASITLAATQEVMSGGDRTTLARMQSDRSAMTFAVSNVAEVYRNSSAWEYGRNLIGLGASADVVAAQQSMADHQQRMSKARSLYGENWYRSITDPNTFRVQIEGRMHRDTMGHEGLLRAASTWASIMWAGGYDNYYRKRQMEEAKEWQDRSMKSMEVAREKEMREYNESIGKAIDRVLANERRRHDAAVAAENYSRWNDWATI